MPRNEAVGNGNRVSWRRWVGNQTVLQNINQQLDEGDFGLSMSLYCPWLTVHSVLIEHAVLLPDHS